MSWARYRSTLGGFLLFELTVRVKASLDVKRCTGMKLCTSRYVPSVQIVLNKYTNTMRFLRKDCGTQGKKETEGFPTVSVIKAAFESHLFNLSPGFIFLASHRRLFLISIGALFRSVRRKVRAGEGNYSPSETTAAT